MSAEDVARSCFAAALGAQVSSRAAMQVLVVATTALVFWIAAWALGMKSFDAFLVGLALVVGSMTVYVFKPYVDRMLGRERP